MGRCESGTGYIKFDVTDVSGQLDSAELNLTVSQDPGSGTIRLYEGTSNNWAEETMSGSVPKKAMPRRNGSRFNVAVAEPQTSHTDQFDWTIQP